MTEKRQRMISAMKYILLVILWVSCDIDAICKWK